MSAELVLVVIATGTAGIGALFGIFGFLRARRLPDALTAHDAAETDIVRAAVEEQARSLRQELGHSLKGFQELTLAGFGTLRDGIDAQVRGFGERLDGGTGRVNETCDGWVASQAKFRGLRGPNSQKPNGERAPALTAHELGAGPDLQANKLIAVGQLTIEK